MLSVKMVRRYTYWREQPNEDRMVVRRRVVDASRLYVREGGLAPKGMGNGALGECSRPLKKNAKTVRSSGLCRLGLEQVDRLHDKVGVADDCALLVDLLRRRVVIRLCVDNVSRLNVLDRHLDHEGRFGLHGCPGSAGRRTWTRACLRCRRSTHRRWVARAGIYL